MIALVPTFVRKKVFCLKTRHDTVIVPEGYEGVGLTSLFDRHTVGAIIWTNWTLSKREGELQRRFRTSSPPHQSSWAREHTSRAPVWTHLSPSSAKRYDYEAAFDLRLTPTRETSPYVEENFLPVSTYNSVVCNKTRHALHCVRELI